MVFKTAEGAKNIGLGVWGDFLDLLFPRAPIVGEIEAMDATQFLALVRARELAQNDKLTFHTGEKPPTSLTSLLSISAGASIDKTFFLFPYKSEAAQTAIWQLKYGKNVKIAKLLAECVAMNLPQLTENGEKMLILPAPISKQRRRERGYNQIEFLLENMEKPARLENFEIRTDLLRKIRHTGAQSKTESREERFANLKNCFAIADPRRVIKGRNVIVLDDVYTTGTTMNEMLRVVRDAGATSAVGLCLAH